MASAGPASSRGETVSYLQPLYVFIPVLTKRDLPFLARNFKELAWCWYEIGLNLKMPLYSLNCIRNPNEIRDQHKQYLIRTLQRWVNKAARQATWRILYEAAIAINKQPVADRIVSEHKDLDQRGT